VFRIPQRSGISERVVFVCSVFAWVLGVTVEVNVFLVVALVTLRDYFHAGDSFAWVLRAI